MDRQERWFRNIAYILYSANTERKDRKPVESFWPMFGDKEKTKDRFVWGDTPEEAAANLLAIKKKHGLA